MIIGDPTPTDALMMKLGAFSISLAVKDLQASRAFYAKLGFAEVGGDAAQGWLILRNAQEVTIGLFHGMFEGNLMTFNPGWGRQCENVDPFDDVREIQRQLEAQGLTLTTRADAATTGPASLMLADPDGNMILVDQHR
jgi:lactoylglutathione lyase